MVVAFTSLLTLEGVQAGSVRTAYSDGVKMIPVYLRMGQSTVLRFIERPKKVVLGNSNYYSVEFIENDLAIQPQGAVTTNLFVYGIKNVYGFILYTNHTGNYDDLVQVDLSENKTQKVEKPKSWYKEVSAPKQSLTLAKTTRVTLTKVYRVQGKDSYLMELFIENTSKSELNLSGVEISLMRGVQKLSPQELVLQKNKLKPTESTGGRIFINLPSKTDFSLSLTQGKTKAKTIIKARFL